jgi:hypothetical protein
VPTVEQAEGYRGLLEDAKAVQAMARGAEEGRVEATEEEEDSEWTERYLTALEEEEDRFWGGEADVVDHGDGDDEEILDGAERVEAATAEVEAETAEVEAETAEAEAETAEVEAATAEDEEWVSGPAWDPEEKDMMRPMREESPVRPERRL